MKTLINKLAKHKIELEKKVQIYEKFFNREVNRFIAQNNNIFVVYHMAKYEALKKTDRYFKIYGEQNE